MAAGRPGADVGIDTTLVKHKRLAASPRIAMDGTRPRKWGVPDTEAPTFVMPGVSGL